MAALAEAVHRHLHRPVEPEHDLVKIVQIGLLDRAVAAQFDAGRGDGGVVMRIHDGEARRQPGLQTSSSSTSNTSVAFGGITPPAPRTP